MQGPLWKATSMLLDAPVPRYTCFVAHTLPLYTHSLFFHLQILTGDHPFAFAMGRKAEGQVTDALFDSKPPYDLDTITSRFPEFDILAKCWGADARLRPTIVDVCKEMGWDD